jgi:hypothetical protein
MPASQVKGLVVAHTKIVGIHKTEKRNAQEYHIGINIKLETTFTKN